MSFAIWHALISAKALQEPGEMTQFGSNAIENIFLNKVIAAEFKSMSKAELVGFAQKLLDEQPNRPGNPPQFESVKRRFEELSAKSAQFEQKTSDHRLHALFNINRVSHGALVSAPLFTWMGIQ
jgi:hypothetical protein